MLNIGPGQEITKEWILPTKLAGYQNQTMSVPDRVSVMAL